MLVNNTSYKLIGLHIGCDVYKDGTQTSISLDSAYMLGSHSCVAAKVNLPKNIEGAILRLRMLDNTGLIDENIYWLQDKNAGYNWLQNMPTAHLMADAKAVEAGKISVSLSDKDDTGLAFFVHVSLVDKRTHKRILPVFCNYNYFSVATGCSRSMQVEYTPQKDVEPQICIEGWNVGRQYIDIKH